MSADAILPDALRADVGILWDYHDMHHMIRRCDVGIGLGSHDLGVATFTADRSRASVTIRSARSALSHCRATTNCASVSDNFATSASRVAAGRSSSASIDSRIAARWP